MIKLPEEAPNWLDIVKKDFKNIFRFSENPLLQPLIQKSDDRYYYWDKIRVQPLPEKLNKNEVWAFIRFRRSLNSAPTPILDVKGNPFTYWLTDNMQKNLHLIDQNTAGSLALDDKGNERNASEKYILLSLMEEAITSSKIEGAASTIKDAKQMLLVNRKPRGKSEQMIYNNYQTMQSIKNLCKRDLSIELILDLHCSITKDTMDEKSDEGKFRDVADDVKVVTEYGQELFTPPDASEIKDRLEILCKFANDDHDRPFVHPVVKAIMLHFWMAYIHPFKDGNGRLARTLFYWYLLKKKYWLFEYTSISKIILEKTTKYAKAYLYSENDDNDLTYFIHFHIEVIQKAVEELKKHIEVEKEKNLKARENILKDPDLNLRQSRIIQHIIDNPNEILTIKIHKQMNGIAYETARTDLMDLVEKGLLKSVHRGKVHYFVPLQKKG